MDSHTRHIHTQKIESPIGELLIGDYMGKICICDWTSSKHHPQNLIRLQNKLDSVVEESETPLLSILRSELDDYFNSKLKSFDLPLLTLGTPFQLKVWNELLKIPYGETVSYLEIAKRIGSPTSVRAVANSVGANPVSILIPCHRVIGSNRTLTGYAAGLEVKSYLLSVESLEIAGIIKF